MNQPTANSYPTQPAPAPISTAQASSLVSHAQMRFEKNVGQFDKSVDYAVFEGGSEVAYIGA
ncbi:hypothetical protein ACSTH7_25455, partial [Vibrio parahaemolyticus]